MAEYIDRDAIYKAFANAGTDVLERASEIEYIAGFSYELVIEILDNIPTVNAAPVVHGQWIIGVDDDDFDVKCSKCEWTDIFEVAGISAVERIAKTMHYCPNCGAKMDKEEGKQ